MAMGSATATEGGRKSGVVERTVGRVVGRRPRVGMWWPGAPLVVPRSSSRAPGAVPGEAKSLATGLAVPLVVVVSALVPPVPLVLQVPHRVRNTVNTKPAPVSGTAPRSLLAALERARLVRGVRAVWDLALVLGPAPPSRVLGRTLVPLAPPLLVVPLKWPLPQLSLGLGVVPCARVTCRTCRPSPRPG